MTFPQVMPVHATLARALAATLVLAAMVVAPADPALASSRIAGTVEPIAAPATQTCVGSVGPGIPPPVGFAMSIPGFHAQWYGQSGYPSLCPGTRSTATVAYYNSGSLGWVAGRMGEVAYLGTWGPEPGQDNASPLGGDGGRGSPATGWPRYDRIATQPAPYVGPGQVAWFQFTIQAPTVAGHYRLYLRPLIEGATWMEDFGVFWLVTVLGADGTAPPPPPAVLSPTGYSRMNVPTSRGTFDVHLIKERLSDVTVRTSTANLADCVRDCPAKPLVDHVAQYGAYAGMHGTYICPPDYAECASKINSYDYAVYNSALGRWINQVHLTSVNGLVTFSGKTPRFFRRAETYDRSAVTAGISNFPLLLQAGAIVNSEAEQTTVQKDRGVKGAIGTDSTFVYLLIATSATVTETAYVLQALGARDALNLDGGGTAAMYVGGTYRFGPGRQLPNAILLTKP